MNTKEENNIDLEQIIKEAELRLKELSEDELTKVSGGDSNGVVFEKGKWVRVGEYEDPEKNTVYELLELNGDEIITNMWMRIRARDYLIPGYIYYTHCQKNMSIPVISLSISIEVPRPDWAHE